MRETREREREADAAMSSLRVTPLAPHSLPFPFPSDYRVQEDGTSGTGAPPQGGEGDRGQEAVVSFLTAPGARV